MGWMVIYLDAAGAAEQRLLDLGSREQAQVKACKLHFGAGGRVDRIQGPNGEVVRFEEFRDQCVRRSSPMPRARGPK